ncbi:MAG TPA: HAMP domain-containing sensor histidine kinase [Candidatus Dormibacteraeota bacterium]|nr:HAMP domain-containing sensor histidine kinase [Candidatus Dormibacteraeota bacterium]
MDGSLLLGDGEYEYRLTPMHGVEGALLRMSGTIVDVTEPRRHEREAMERRARKMFTAKASHGLRTPLNAMLGFLQLLQGRRGDGLSDRQRGHLKRVETAVRLQLDLVNDLLDVQKLRSGEPHFDVEATGVAPLLEDVVEMVRPVAAAKDVRLVTDLPKTRLATDRRRLSQVVLNLLSNSIKFSPRGEQVVLQALASADRLVIEVVDHGPGSGRGAAGAGVR